MASTVAIMRLLVARCEVLYTRRLNWIRNEFRPATA
jgi:hypothetical protein